MSDKTALKRCNRARWKRAPTAPAPDPGALQFRELCRARGSRAASLDKGQVRFGREPYPAPVPGALQGDPSALQKPLRSGLNGVSSSHDGKNAV